ncbi:MAG TPA: alpha/beta fold hydrolase [Thermoleophilaceae bacterium]|nr:alpha/beta fold hydrolase [Thermoleophilaceae bacterium]
MRRLLIPAIALALTAAAPASAATTKPLKAPSGLAFYKPPAKLPGKTHGDVIWSRAATGKSKLKGADTRLVLYRSVGVRGKAVGVSGLVSVPRGKAPKGGFPVVSWAHGTTGIADKTAPTRLGGASDYIRKSLLEAWVKKGYAVVRTDYEGLGTPGRHPYLIGSSEGRSVLDIVRAARKLDGDVSSRLAISGHSQGGHAALFAAALAPRWTPELKLRGTAAFAPASQLDEQVPLVRSLTTPGGLSVLVGLIGAGIQIGYPSVDLRSLLTPSVFALLPQADRRDMGGLARPDSFGGVAPSQMFRPGANLAPLLRVLARNDPSELKIKTPVRVEQGTADDTVLPPFTDRMVAALRKSRTKLTYVKTTGQSHTGIVNATAADVRRWIDARLRR